MKEKLTLSELTQELEPSDADILYSIYQYRCLQREHIMQIHFIKKPGDATPSEKGQTSKAINRLTKYELIKEKEYLGGKIAYFLTPQGIDVLRNFYSMPANIYDAQKNVVRRGYHRASELDMNPRLINHQMHLNQFVIDFFERYSGPPVRYYDEKYASIYHNIRPDGILSFSEVDVFLEMDMATESKNQLFEKWENYRNFLNSSEYHYKDKKILVLFIVGNTNRERERRDAIQFTIYERLLDMFDGGFDIVVNNHENLLTYLTEEVLPAVSEQSESLDKLKQVLETKHKMTLTEGEKLSNIFQRNEFLLYGRKLGESGRIVVEDGRIQEFLVDHYFGCPASVIAKIVYAQKNNMQFRKSFDRSIGYLVVVDDIAEIRKDVRMANALKVEGVYYTTIERLDTLPLHQAICKLDASGNIFHYKNNGLLETVFESAE